MITPHQWYFLPCPLPSSIWQRDAAGSVSPQRLFGEGAGLRRMSSLFDLWRAWLPVGGLAHNDAASFERLLSHRAEADRCFQAQLMPVSSPEPRGCGVGGPGIPLGR